MSKKETVSVKLEIINELGIHARPAAMFVRVANKFKSYIFVEKDGERVNGKSIMGIMMLAAAKGTHIKIIAVGADAKAAADELQTLVNGKFGEN